MNTSWISEYNAYFTLGCIWEIYSNKSRKDSQINRLTYFVEIYVFEIDELGEVYWPNVEKDLLLQL